MSQEENKPVSQQTEEATPELTPEQKREAELKKKIEELRKRDPFIYR